MVSSGIANLTVQHPRRLGLALGVEQASGSTARRTQSSNHCWNSCLTMRISSARWPASWKGRPGLSAQPDSMSKASSWLPRGSAWRSNGDPDWEGRRRQIGGPAPGEVNTVPASALLGTELRAKYLRPALSRGHSHLPKPDRSRANQRGRVIPILPKAKVRLIVRNARSTRTSNCWMSILAISMRLRCLAGEFGSNYVRK